MDMCSSSSQWPEYTSSIQNTTGERRPYPYNSVKYTKEFTPSFPEQQPNWPLQTSNFLQPLPHYSLPQPPFHQSHTAEFHGPHLQPPPFHNAYHQYQPFAYPRPEYNSVIHGYNYNQVQLPPIHPTIPEPVFDQPQHYPSYMENSSPSQASHFDGFNYEHAGKAREIDTRKVIFMCDEIRVCAMENQTDRSIEAMYNKSLQLQSYISEFRDKSNMDNPTATERSKKRNRLPTLGRCHSCNCFESPEWRRGPDGAKTLCNACGLRYKKILKLQQKRAKLATSENNDQLNEINDDTITKTAEIATAGMARK